MEFRDQTGSAGRLGSETDRAGRDIETGNSESGTGPRPNVMTGAAARNAHLALRQLRVCGEEVDESWRRRALFPWHVTGLVSAFPVVATHGMGRNSVRLVGDLTIDQFNYRRCAPGDLGIVSRHDECGLFLGSQFYQAD